MNALVQEAQGPRSSRPDPDPVFTSFSPCERTVLVVEPDDTERDRLVGALRGVGYSVQSCPGPGVISCPVETFAVCELARKAGTIVLDMKLASEDHLDGVSPNELLGAYVGEAKSVVALTAALHAIRPYLDEHVSALSRRPEAPELIAAVGGAIRHGSAPSNQRDQGR